MTRREISRTTSLHGELHDCDRGRRALVKAGAIALAGLSTPTSALSISDYGLLPHQVADGVWMIEGVREGFDRRNGGAISNVVLIESSDGAIIIDTGSTARQGAEIRAIAEQRFGGVAATLITHHHPDHWFGNAAFEHRPIMATASTVESCTQNAQGYSDALYTILGRWMSGTRAVVPTRLIEPGEQVIGGRRLTLMEFSGHTGSDLVVRDERSGVLIAGDLLFLERAPSLPDANVADWLETLSRLNGLRMGGVIPGHGPYHESDAALLQTRAYLVSIDERLRLAAESGLSPVETLRAGPAPEFRGLGANPSEFQRSVIQRWADYEQSALPLISAG